MKPRTAVEIVEHFRDRAQFGATHWATGYGTGVLGCDYEIIGPSHCSSLVFDRGESVFGVVASHADGTTIIREGMPKRADAMAFLGACSDALSKHGSQAKRSDAVLFD